MAITSLQNFGAWTQTPDQVMLMPKLAYRFRVILLGFGMDPSIELTKQVAKVGRPQVDFQEIDLPIYNSRIYLAGKYEWQSLELELRDDASGQVQKMVGRQMQKQFDFMEQASARSGIDYKFTMQVEILDGGNATLEPQILETFALYGCFIQSANYSDLEYDLNEAALVTLTIRFDNAVQFAASQTAVGPGGGIGDTVGRVTDSELPTGASGGMFTG